MQNFTDFYRVRTIKYALQFICILKHCGNNAVEAGMG